MRHEIANIPLSQSEISELHSMVNLINRKFDRVLGHQAELCSNADLSADQLICLNSSEEVFLHCKEMQSFTKETFRVLYLDEQNRLLADEILGIGTARRCFVEPQEIFRLAFKYDAAKIITIHNHPSGSSLPSKADLELFERLETMSKILEMPLADNIIIAREASDATKPACMSPRTNERDLTL